MQIILLAAGRGLRLGNKTATTPKTLLPVGGKPVLLHILQGLARYPEDRIVVVGGFEFNRLGDFLSSQPIKTVLVRNTDYEKGNLLSLVLKRRKGAQTRRELDYFGAYGLLQRVLQG